MSTNAVKPEQAGAGSHQLLTFVLGNETYGVDILRVQEGETDVMPGLSSDQKKDKLSRISYRDYLKTYLKVNEKTLAFYQTITHDEYGTGIDAEPALDCWGFGLPGFKGLKLKPG